MQKTLSDTRRAIYREKCREYTSKVQKGNKCSGTQAQNIDLNELLAYAKESQLAYTYFREPAKVPVGTIMRQPESVEGAYCPAYFYRQEPNMLLIAIKGTSTMADVKADIEFVSSFESVRNLVNPRYHDGMVESAVKLLIHDKVYKDVIVPAVDAGKPIRLTGHSLGGGIAVVILLVLKEILLKERGDIHAFVFGCPAIMPICFSQRLEPYITSVVHDMDTITRLPNFPKLVVPGHERIIQVSECSPKTKVFVRDYRWFKKDIVGYNTQREDHRIRRYIEAIESVTPKPFSI